ncbi:hypothetical protein BD410DRAFT_842741 [Rickenella mellea]|uniref:Uncharacterized protein n=1 Tax=Rickenella mellea TaxID=50990 RepID=A0A4Y7PT26_9AGAM|nr:hypothetical protein BD410DRAFT_842741 [Rickenella mellea]
MASQVNPVSSSYLPDVISHLFTIVDLHARVNLGVFRVGNSYYTSSNTNKMHPIPARLSDDPETGLRDAYQKAKVIQFVNCLLDNMKSDSSNFYDLHPSHVHYLAKNSNRDIDVTPQTFNGNKWYHITVISDADTVWHVFINNPTTAVAIGTAIPVSMKSRKVSSAPAFHPRHGDLGHMYHPNLPYNVPIFWLTDSRATNQINLTMLYTKQRETNSSSNPGPVQRSSKEALSGVSAIGFMRENIELMDRVFSGPWGGPAG